MSITVRIDTGQVAGTVARDARTQCFLGIPFAQPPVGPLRWRPPQPATPWEGVRCCDRYGDAPVQPALHAGSIMGQFGFDEPPECGISEDCLYLNVWAPRRTADTAAAGPAPVIVFVYGGGHRVGSGSHRVSRGEGLARQGAVVVTFNYRVGALGYLAHPELTREQGASGHYAALDVLAALEWVQRNIAAFGGDPQCVTLFGQSAGAALVNVLMASPLASELFQRAIVHSSGRFRGGPMGGPMKRLEEAEQAGAALAAAQGAYTLEELRALPADAIEGPRGFWGPIIDGDVLRQPVQTAFERGEQMDVPLLAGYTHDEASPYPTPALHTRAAFEQHAYATFGADADRFLQLYPCADDTAATAAAYALRRDTTFAYQPWMFARLHQRTSGSPVYLFNFDHAPPLPEDLRFSEPRPPGGYGAYHGSELWYAFQTLGSAPFEASALDWAVSDAMSACWIAFARDGIPRAEGLPAWPAFGETDAALVLGPVPRVAVPFNAPALRFFEAHFAAR